MSNCPHCGNELVILKGKQKIAVQIDSHKYADFDLWEQSILKYLNAVRMPRTIRGIANRTMMAWVTCKKKLKGLELNGKVKSVKVGTRTKYEIVDW